MTDTINLPRNLVEEILKTCAFTLTEISYRELRSYLAVDCERAEFEKWARTISFRDYPLEWLKEQRLYTTQKANIAWEAWNARARLNNLK